MPSSWTWTTRRSQIEVTERVISSWGLAVPVPRIFQIGS
jgi:hypothetical protein